MLKLTITDLIQGSDTTNHSSYETVWEEIDLFVDGFRYIIDADVKNQLKTFRSQNSIYKFIELYNANSMMESLIFLCDMRLHMPNYTNSYFDCTVAIGHDGTKMLMSKLPTVIDWVSDEIINSENMPQVQGLYRCRIYMNFKVEQVYNTISLNTYLKCSEYYPTHYVIKEVEVVLDNDRQSPSKE